MFTKADFKIGQKVRCISIDADYGLYDACLDQVGIIRRVRDTEWRGETIDIEVHFDHIVLDRHNWFFLPHHLVLEDSSPEEIANYQEKLRVLEEQKQDKLRRKAHADKYL